MTFVYANDSATAISPPFDRDTQKWQQVTGLWTGTARSGAVTLNAAQAHERNASSVQTDARHPGPAPEHLALLTAYLGGNKDARIRDPGVLRWADIGLKRINRERDREPDKQPQLIPQEAAR